MKTLFEGEGMKGLNHRIELNFMGKYPMSTWKQYKRKGLSEMRPYAKGEDLTKISVADVDDPENDMGRVARNPLNHDEQWYVARKYFEDNLELAEG